MPKEYVAILEAKSEMNAFRYEYILDKGMSAVYSLPPDTGLPFPVNYYPKFEGRLIKKISEIKKKDPGEPLQPVENKLRGKHLILKIAVFANDKKTAKIYGDQMKRFILAP